MKQKGFWVGLTCMVWASLSPCAADDPSEIRNQSKSLVTSRVEKSAVAKTVVEKSVDDQHFEIVSRTWTQRDGNQLDGKFVAKIENLVKIEDENGIRRNIGWIDLVEEDQQYIELVIEKLGPTPLSRTWSDINGRNFRGCYVRLDGSEVEFLLDGQDKTVRLETLLLSAQDIDYIIDQLNRSLPRAESNQQFRIWSYQDANQNERRMIGIYVGLNQENLILNQPHGVRTIPIARLKSKDLDFIVAIDKATRGAIDPIRNANEMDLAASQQKKDYSSGVPSLSPIWWFSLGLIFLLLIGLISIKYLYESGGPEYDDKF